METICVENSSGLTFAVPPSLGRRPMRVLARRLADLLSGAGFTRVIPMETYADTARAVLEGEADAAWAPPLVCALAERAGSRVALRARRFGETSYRSVLVCHVYSDIDMERLRHGGPHRAAWVSRWSMGGYLLPRHLLRANGVDVSGPMLDEVRVGSYEDCFNAVLGGEADVTASFVRPGIAGRNALGYVQVCGSRAHHLRPFGYTDPCPNDGIILAPHLGANEADALAQALRAVTADPRNHELVGMTFEADGFDVPEAGTYAPLLEMVDDPDALPYHRGGASAHESPSVG